MIPSTFFPMTDMVKKLQRFELGECARRDDAVFFINLTEFAGVTPWTPSSRRRSSQSVFEVSWFFWASKMAQCQSPQAEYGDMVMEMELLSAAT